ncbi:MAG: hypothetical protein OIN88_12360 [Candidatus Methanoperedens sp.]|nr:hypothetical protein [Candidatus Methanoperedens sp.]HLB71580.1 hypothetical protein [Candidatus Methanoperedens sp.]
MQSKPPLDWRMKNLIMGRARNLTVVGFSDLPTETITSGQIQIQ